MEKNTASNRMQPIEWLSALPHITGVDIELLRSNEDSARRLYGSIGLVPTIGCEVEIKSSAVFPELAKEYFGKQDKYGHNQYSYGGFDEAKKAAFDAEYNRLDTKLKPWYEMTKAAGIPQGCDSYWEFANAPAYSWKTLAAEVGLLFDSDLIPEGSNHSLHITLGGVEIGKGGMAYVLGGLELLFIPPERIEAATMPNRLGTQSTWARRGDDGMRPRYAGGLALEQTTATELRTLTVSYPEQAASIFETSQMLGAMLTAYRKRKTSADPLTQALAFLWDEYRCNLKDLWLEHGLPLQPWGKPKDKPEYWLKWAGAIAERDSGGSLEQETVKKFQRLIDMAASLIKSF